MPKSVEHIGSMFGVLYAGYHYMPLDPGMPVERLLAIIDGSGLTALICADEYDVSCLSGAGVVVARVSEVMTEHVDADANVVKFLAKRVIDQDPAYVINTSGSTGLPKGVTVSHKSVFDYIEWAKSVFDIDSIDVIGNQAPMYFDNSVLDIYLMASTGASLYLIEDKAFSFPGLLFEKLHENHVSFLFWVPSIMAAFMRFKVFDAQKLSSLKYCLFAGEVMQAKVLGYWMDSHPAVIFANLYGPTEITVDCTYKVIERRYEDDEEVPIGVSCANTEVFLVDAQNNLITTPYIIGQILVRGTGVSLGYLNDELKTSSAFIQNPAHNKYPERVYQTGDLACYDNNGDLLYRGRQDNQIKHQGYRIELGEIEICALSTLTVSNVCACYDADLQQIILFCESADEILYKDALSLLKRKLPKYMLPRQIITHDVLPLTSNGKVDRRALMRGREYHVSAR